MKQIFWLIALFTFPLYLPACGHPDDNYIDMNRLRPPAQVPLCQTKVIDEEFCSFYRDGFEYHKPGDFCAKWYDKQCDDFWWQQHERRHGRNKAPRGPDTSTDTSTETNTDTETSAGR